MYPGTHQHSTHNSILCRHFALHFLALRPIYYSPYLSLHPKARGTASAIQALEPRPLGYTDQCFRTMLYCLHDHLADISHNAACREGHHELSAPVWIGCFALAVTDYSISGHKRFRLPEDTRHADKVGTATAQEAVQVQIPYQQSNHGSRAYRKASCG